MLPSYRDPNYAASVRLEQIRERDGEIQDHIPHEIRIIHARRAARSAFGWTAIVGFVAVGAVAGLNVVIAPAHLPTTFALLGALGLSLVAYGIAYQVALFGFDRKVLATFDAAEDPLSRLARIEAAVIGETAARIVARSEPSSLWLPLAGVGLLVPLHLHLAYHLLTKGFSFSSRVVEGFDWWIGASLILVGFAHLVLAFQGFRFASKASQMSTVQLEAKAPVSGWAALGWTVLGSLLPGVIAIGIPPVLVFVTGILFIPYMFGTMHRRLVAERHVLEGA